MKKAQLVELMRSMQEALAHSRGKLELRTTVLPSAPEPMTAQEIRAIRES